ncbi:hypothetical protein D9M71_694560 [compost metagenome]
MVGARHAQEEMAGEADPDQGDAEACGQLQRDQRQGQRLAASPRQHLGQQGCARALRRVVVLMEVQLIQAP